MLVNAKKRRRGAVLLLAAAALIMTAPAVLAQTTTTPPYPGNPTTTTPGPTNVTQDLGLKALGSRFTVTVTGFQPGSIVHLTVNGVAIVPDLIADTNGNVSASVEISADLVALRSAGLGRMLAATGLAASGTNVQVIVNGQAVKVGPLGSVVNMVFSGTGSNLQPRQATVKFTVVKPSTLNSSGLARTGTTILKWSPLGAGLVAVGYMLVLVARRRRAAVS